jgi:nickel-dependent lactate racemase
MRITMDFAHEHLELNLDEQRVVGRFTAPGPALADPAAAVRAALEAPYHFPALRRALTPDDHVAVVVDERLAGLGRLLGPLLEHLASAGVAPAAITLVCSPGTSRQEWVEELPEEFEDVHMEVHDPKNRQGLAYLATTAAGRRLYLNRRVVEADQVVVLGCRRYDPLLGHGGAEGDLFPALADEETRTELYNKLHLTSPGGSPWPVRREAVECSWLLGTPFFVQLIEGADDQLVHVVAGVAEASDEGQRLLDRCWKHTVPGPADLVVATVGGAPGRATFAELADALASASRVVQPGGRIILLSRASPEIGPGAGVLSGAEEPEEALKHLQRDHRPELFPALQWAQAAARAHISLLSDWPDETVEELFAGALHDGGQVQRWLDRGGSCLFLQDAHKMLVVPG